MKSRLNLLVILSVLILIQVSIINNGLLFRFYPNIVLVFTVYLAQKKGRIIGGIYGLISGLLMDVLLSPNLGIKALAFLIVGYGIGIISEYIFEENNKTAIFYVLVGSFIYNVVNLFIYFFLSYNVTISFIFLNILRVETMLEIFIFIVYQEMEIERLKRARLPSLKRNWFYWKTIMQTLREDTKQYLFFQ